jgi:hypothetical protein
MELAYTPPEIPELRRSAANDITAEMATLPASMTLPDMYGLETVDKKTGAVDLVPIVDSGPKRGQEFKTTVSTLLLARYEQGGEQHDVTLYTRSHEDPQEGSVFAVDRATDAEGNTRLAATPAVLFDNLADNTTGAGRETQLKTAILTGASPSELQQLIAAEKQGDTETAARIRGNLEAALRNRRPEGRISVDGLSDRGWAARGFHTPAAVKQHDEQNKRLRQERAEVWEKASKIRKGVEWALWGLGARKKYSDIQTAHHWHNVHRERARNS